jgi:hypothetical protein
VNGQPKGYYRINNITDTSGWLGIQAVYGGNTAQGQIKTLKQFTGYEIVSVLPNSALFVGRMVFLNSAGQQKLYRYTSAGWTAAVSGADIVAGSVTTDAMFAGRIITAKIGATELSVVSTKAGTIDGGILQSPSGGSRFDLNNARIIFNSAPGQTGGYVRVTGAGFGPSADYLDWYGAKPAGTVTDAAIIAALTDAGASWFLKTDGSSRAAGRLRGEFEPKAWVRFNGETATMLDRFNIGSVARLAEGRYRIAFASAVANINYAANITAARFDGSEINPLIAGSLNLTTTQFDVSCKNAAGNYRDATEIAVTVFGSNVPGSSNVATPSGAVGGGTIGFGNIP